MIARTHFHSQTTESFPDRRKLSFPTMSTIPDTPSASDNTPSITQTPNPTNVPPIIEHPQNNSPSDGRYPPPLLGLSILTPTINVKNSISIELTYTNYLNWKKVFIIFLGSQRLFRFVDGTLPRPDPTHPYSTWVQYDELVHSWINSTHAYPMMKTLLNHDCTSAQHVWLTLEHIYLDHAQSTRMMK
ncbi:hypothetical protein LIER_19146 [Lithospermum erythrorhizon]|uniref:Retrotransposon Copia-like N-terminal domain-containing protein n=1 Tax=Lithospermum erythrorhizon TaxID=34254 RepID=A0AAV3QJL9_LITER